MDDNTKKSKTPALISKTCIYIIQIQSCLYTTLLFYLGFSYFLRMLGPATGYALASVCLKFYISPTLTPAIDNNDPRWLGAWWLGWLILGSTLIFFATLIGLFPKILPRAAMRKAIAAEKLKHGLITEVEPEIPASFKGKTSKKYLNHICLCFLYFRYDCHFQTVAV